MSKSKDTIYATPREAISDFVFDDNVASVFTDMINRSVPGYPLILEMIGVITRRFAQPDTYCYDLGCSLGGSTISMARNLRPECSNTRIRAVDNSQAMLTHLEANIAKQELQHLVEPRCENIQATPIDNASLVVMNFTLQFIDPTERIELLDRIYRGMNKGGALVLSEKITIADSNEQALLVDLHHDFKRARGYSDMEIAQKRQALENVLHPESMESHRKRLVQAGFRQITCWFQCFNFVSLLAVK